ncbi:Hypothetical_protein [Hexamita inflata]|uniref:Hypothetical_protein n=1 Tax=Hexamita inflata TaxID=28002 RepID=A0AA86P7V5_9EUKA|nr:Hypothetical protein HINF_LOCUS20213 [Hexamita inflata]
MQQVLQQTTPDLVDPLINYIMQMQPSQYELFTTASKILTPQCFQTVLTSLILMQLQQIETSFDYLNNTELEQFITQYTPLVLQQEDLQSYVVQLLELTPTQNLYLINLLQNLFIEFRFPQANITRQLINNAGEACKICKHMCYKDHKCCFMEQKQQAVVERSQFKSWAEFLEDPTGEEK